MLSGLGNKKRNTVMLALLISGLSFDNIVFLTILWGIIYTPQNSPIISVQLSYY